MINIQPAAENKWALNKFYGKQKLIIYETIDFEDQICVLPAGPKSFYLPSSQRQIKNSCSLRPRLCGEIKLQFPCVDVRASIDNMLL